MALIQCPECGKDVSDAAFSCPACGHPLKVKEKVKINRKIVIIVAVLLIAVLGVWISNNVLWGNDRIAYEIMVECADNFKDPSSLRIVVGRLGVENDCLFVRIRAKNGFGSYNTGDYFFSASGWVLEDDDIDSLLNNPNINASKINRIYERNYG